jgi:hypothetical protein
MYKCGRGLHNTTWRMRPAGFRIVLLPSLGAVLISYSFLVLKRNINNAQVSPLCLTIKPNRALRVQRYVRQLSASPGHFNLLYRMCGCKSRSGHGTERRSRESKLTGPARGQLSNSIPEMSTVTGLVKCLLWHCKVHYDVHVSPTH